jgi:DNA-binding LacI/PurR family transcriptional regulator
MRSRAPTLNQVAALAGVSHQTVSRVLNRHANVSANTRARVLAAIHQLDYQPNTAARTLVTDRSQTIGLITFDGTLAGPSSIVWAVPGDVSVVGFDDLPETAFLLPPLTTIRHDFAEIGRRSIHLLIRQITDDVRNLTIPTAISPRLVVRSSTVPPPVSSSNV